MESDKKALLSQRTMYMYVNLIWLIVRFDAKDGCVSLESTTVGNSLIFPRRNDDMDSHGRVVILMTIFPSILKYYPTQKLPTLAYPLMTAHANADRLKIADNLHGTWTP